ncbi:competence protein ComFA [Terribacillus aidingensis]|uniref:Competence protein ComFA n=1 Tax=Terribacillus aidingensis TaxID=586416 RepID=A0A285N6R1_9BACI|nr:DEAD/DEAH box helicase [Terribacillus aidingensis]SNZ05110.1 competence protein ComFA [Terribacillus aidingensis]
MEIEPKHFSGKRLLRREIPLSSPLFKQALQQQCFKKILGIRKEKGQAYCSRCNASGAHLQPIACQKCEQTHLYCRNCIQMGRVSACEQLYEWTGPEPEWPVHAAPCAWDGELTVHQQVAADAIDRAIQRNEKLLAHAVCGAGKTEMLFQGITCALRQGKRVCLATPRADVVRELLPRFHEAFPNVTIQALYGGSPDKTGEGQLILATTHQLLRFYRAFDVLIIDEIDAFPYHADSMLHFASDKAKKTACASIFLTATPRKKEKRAIKAKTLPYVFVPLRFHGNPLPVPSSKICFGLHKKLKQGSLPKGLLTWLQKRKNPTRQVLLFLPTVALADSLKKDAISALHPFAKKIHSKNTAETLISTVHAADKEREEKVQAFRNREIAIILTTTILERGVTFPSVDVAILDAAHDVFDEAGLVQIAGRAGRSPADPTGEVVFFHEGRSTAMDQAVQAIQYMNRQARKL